MTAHAGYKPLGFDPKIPSEARVYDYYMGGKDNFAADRHVARLALKIAPELPLMCREGRRFLERVVRHLAAAGIRQFIDVGCGLPTQGNVHEIAREAAPGSRVVYVDNDPMVVRHAQALLADDDSCTAVIEADMRDPRALLNHPRLTEVIDLEQPVAILVLFTLVGISDDDAAHAIVRGFREAVAPGSYLAIAHSVSDLCPETTARLTALFQDDGMVSDGPRRDQLRTKAEVEQFFDGLSLIEPGVVYIVDWRPGTTKAEGDGGGVWSVGGLGRVAARTAATAPEPAAPEPAAPEPAA
ncbi:SAM-dependent methyltransferase [Sphaerisporangium sp. NPDC051017]|uniref:SAM-dependent methyltransferase n=1 Tax=Sphaerisporangium sp. NPDC051017 TaxID=3154636 RepID=UPI00342B5C43